MLLVAGGAILEVVRSPNPSPHPPLSPWEVMAVLEGSVVNVSITTTIIVGVLVMTMALAARPPVRAMSGEWRQRESSPM